jgi:hypothetical protein
MYKLGNENVANEIKYTEHCITIQMKSSSLLPYVNQSYVVASLSADPVHFVLNTAEGSHHIINYFKTNVELPKC